jgi:hypothetical protein
MLQAYAKLAAILVALLIGVSALALARPEASGDCEGTDLRSASHAPCSVSVTPTEPHEEIFQRVSY